MAKKKQKKKTLRKTYASAPKPVVSAPQTVEQSFLREYRYGIGVLGLALALRITYLIQMYTSPLYHGFVLDTVQYDQLATQISKGFFFSPEAVFLNPLYPFFVGFWYFIFGHNPMAICVVQVVLDTINCILVFYITLRLFDRTAAVLAAIVYACYGLVIFYTGMLLAPILAIHLMLMFICVLLWQKSRQGIGRFFAAGIVFGLLVLLRANLILILLFMPVWFLLYLPQHIRRRRAKQAGACFAAGVIIVLLCGSIRNYVIDKRLSPFSVHGGLNLYIGNNPKAPGYYSNVMGVANSPIQQITTSIRIASEKKGRPLTAAEASRYWRNQAVSFFTESPLDALGLQIKKTILFLSQKEISLNIDYAKSRRLVPIMNLPFFSFGCVAPLAILGVVLLFRRRSNFSADIALVLGIMGCTMVSVVIFFISDRYRLPVVPFLTIFASFGMVRLYEMLRRKKWTQVWMFGAVLGGVFLLVNADLAYQKTTDDFETRTFHNNLGVAYLNMGRFDAAEKEFKAAIALFPELPDTYYNLGIVLIELEKYAESEAASRKVTAHNPDDYFAHSNLGYAVFKQGRYHEAIRHFETALRLNPNYAIAFNNWGMALSALGEYEQAVEKYRKSIAIDPNNALAYKNMGDGLKQIGKAADAEKAYKRAAELNPIFKPAR